MRPLPIAAAAAGLVMVFLAAGGGEPFELPARDALLRALPERAATATVVVAIDEASIRTVGAWPWPRPTIATLIDRAADSGARAVVLDILLAEERAGDGELARAAKRLPALAVSALDERGEWLLPDVLLRDAVTPAHGNFELDHDGILRRFAATKQSRTLALTAMSVAASAFVTKRPVPVGRSIVPAFRTPAHDVPRISAAELLQSPNVAQRLRGKLVFIGPTAFALGDRVLTPTSKSVPDPGVTVHAAATESIIRGEDVRTLPPIAAGLLAAAGVFAILRARRRQLLIGAAIATTTLIAALLLLATMYISIPVVTLIALFIITTVVVEAMRLVTTTTTLTAARERDAESKRLLAHELRTPLASMRGLSQLLAGFPLSEPERQRVASLLESEAGKLESLVEVLLELERLPLRDFASSTAVLDLTALAAARVELLRAGTQRQLLFRGEGGILMRGDQPMLERIIDNLVGNALKYTASDVAVRVIARDGAAMLEVEDRGSGITEAERARIFDRFFRGRTAAGTSGLGLGLSLVAEIARWHGGNVTLHEAAAGGSLFRVQFPRTGVA